jgi:DNA-binding NarL/FixJ family response regulator
VRRGLKQIACAEPDMQVVGEAENGAEVLRFVRTHPCDVVVQDIAMPGQDGLAVLAELRHEFPRLPVLVLSMHPAERYGLLALRLGAAGYLSKKTVPEELVVAIRKVVAGGRYITPSLADHLAARVAVDDRRPPHEALSGRERQVLRMIAAGKKPQVMASELGLSPKSISAYRGRILEKMGMQTNAEIIRYAIEHHLDADADAEGDEPCPEGAPTPAKTLHVAR